MTAVELTRDERVVRQTSGPVLGMVVFVASEAMFFATFFGAYFTIYSVNPVWPPAGFPRLEPQLATVLTVLLVASSVTLQVGVRAIRRDRTRAMLVWLGLTILLGVGFLGLQLYDYSLLGFGVRDGIFGSLFYVMTGLHMAHVFGGVVFLVLVLVQGLGGQLTHAHHDSMEAGSIYWHFVDVVWICLFITFYVIGLS
ncbi:MAG TPA: heme-copper oxidase subunit III [Actinomycetota bacterium]